MKLIKNQNESKRISKADKKRIKEIRKFRQGGKKYAVCLDN